MSRTYLIFVAFIVALFATACVGEETVYENEGLALLAPAQKEAPSQLPPAEPVSLEADSELQVVVQLDDCLGCEDIEEHSCEATVDGNTIQVTSRAVTTERGGMCPAVCGYLIVTCDLGTLAAGDYTLRYAGAEGTVSIPTDESPAVGEPRF